MDCIFYCFEAYTHNNRASFVWSQNKAVVINALYYYHYIIIFYITNNNNNNITYIQSTAAVVLYAVLHRRKSFYSRYEARKEKNKKKNDLDETRKDNLHPIRWPKAQVRRTRIIVIIIWHVRIIIVPDNAFGRRVSSGQISLTLRVKVYLHEIIVGRLYNYPPTPNLTV